MSARVLIFGKDAWPHTRAAREAYQRRGVAVEYVDVLRDGSRMPEMLKRSGGERRVPVIVDGGKVEVGFGGHSWGIWTVGRAPTSEPWREGRFPVSAPTAGGCPCGASAAPSPRAPERALNLLPEFLRIPKKAVD